MDFETLYSQLKTTLYKERHPRYIVLFRTEPDEQTIWRMSVDLTKITTGVYFSYASYNEAALARELGKTFPLDGFLIAEISGYNVMLAEHGQNSNAESSSKPIDFHKIKPVNNDSEREPARCR